MIFMNEVWQEEFGEFALIGAGDRFASSIEIS